SPPYPCLNPAEDCFTRNMNCNLRGANLVFCNTCLAPQHGGSPTLANVCAGLLCPSDQKGHRAIPGHQHGGTWKHAHGSSLQAEFKASDSAPGQYNRLARSACAAGSGTGQTEQSKPRWQATRTP